MAQLVAQAVTAALDSGLDAHDAIACFGMASRILLDQAPAGLEKPDPHTSFGKGLAHLAGPNADAYH